jgi:hypothetical protein
MSGLFKSPIFRRSMTQFAVLAIVTGIFAYLTLNNDNNIARTPCPGGATAVRRLEPPLSG